MKLYTKIFLIIVGLISSHLSATTYYVSKAGASGNDGLTWGSAFSSISLALTHSVVGDNIWVAMGNYQEGLITIPEHVYVYGGFSGAELALSERNISLYQSVIDGNNSNRCVDNNGTLDGFYVTNGSVHSAFKAGGILNDGMVRYCTIYNNSTDGSGGGVYNQGAVQKSIFYGNSATMQGGAVYNYGAVQNCLIYSNSSDKYGGGIYNSSLVRNCTVYGNTATTSGGGITHYAGTIMNTIVWANSAADISGNMNGISYSCFLEADGTNSNTVDYPFLADPAANDYHLLKNSPCIDSGTSFGAPGADLEGAARPGGWGVDMGAFEFYPAQSSVKNQYWTIY